MPMPAAVVTLGWRGVAEAAATALFGLEDVAQRARRRVISAVPRARQQGALRIGSIGRLLVILASMTVVLKYYRSHWASSASREASLRGTDGAGLPYGPAAPVPWSSAVVQAPAKLGAGVRETEEATEAEEVETAEKVEEVAAVEEAEGVEPVEVAMEIEASETAEEAEEVDAAETQEIETAEEAVEAEESESRELEVAAPSGAEDSGADSMRAFLRVGTWYQNVRGTLLNREKEPISVTLQILELDRFQLIVEYLSSPSGPGSGWFMHNGSFQLLPLAETGRMLLGPKEGCEEAWIYDSEVLTKATNLALRCLESAKGAALSALQLEVNTARDTVLVVPHSALRWIWRDSVTLERTGENDLWRSGGAAEHQVSEGPRLAIAR